MKKGQKMPEEQRLRMIGNKRGSRNKGRIFSEETRLKMSKAKIGKIYWAKGRKLSTETRNKISLAHKGRIFTEEQKEINRQAQYKRYKRINPEYQVIGRNKRIALNGGFHTNGEWELLKTQYNFTCPACHKIEPEIKLTKDHIISLLRGGSNKIENIQPLCQSCNSKKHTQIIRY